MKHHVYRAFERFWHWSQAGLILFLAATGFEIHGTISFFGFGQAVRYHGAAAMALLVLTVFAVFWHLATGEWRQYVPTARNLRAYADFYLHGIFHGARHPTRKTALSKLNPLQRLVYSGLKVILIPWMAGSGVLYMFYRYPQRYEVVTLKIGGLAWIAAAHVLGSFLLVAFVVAHVYLTTTGESLLSNLKAMITGYEDVPPSGEIQVGRR